MNNDNHSMDERLLKQVDERLDNAKPSDYPMINLLAEMLSSADTLSTADPLFQDELESRLVTRLQSHHQQKEETAMLLTTTARMPQRRHAYSYVTWAAALIAIMLLGGYVLTRTQPTQPTLLPSAMQSATAEPMHTIVIATTTIEAGTTITDDKVAIINLSALDFQKLQTAQPQRKFFSKAEDVVGQTTTTALFWFEPVEPIKLGIVEGCAKTDLSCVETPDGLYTITLPMPMTSVAGMGLVAGDHVNVLASADNQLKVVVEDVVLVSIQQDNLTFAAPSWKQSVLIWLWHSQQPYALSPYQGETPARDETLTDYTFTSPEPLPDNYKFHLIAGLPDSKGYQLTGSPYALESIQYTQRDTLMQFWFTNLDVVSITDGTTVVIRLPASDAALLDFLLKKDAALVFIPQ